MENLAFHSLHRWKMNYTTNSPYLNYTFSQLKVKRMYFSISRLKQLSPSQTDATCCMQHFWIMLQHVEQRWPNERNTVQHGGQTHTTCCMQQCCVRLAGALGTTLHLYGRIRWACCNQLPWKRKSPSYFHSINSAFLSEISHTTNWKCVLWYIADISWLSGKFSLFFSCIPSWEVGRMCIMT